MSYQFGNFVLIKSYRTLCLKVFHG